MESTEAGWPTAWKLTVRQPEGEDAASASDLASVDDRALVAAYAAGRRDAFDVIVERHRRSVYRLCRRFAATHEDAADLAQDVFVRAFKGLGSFKGDASLGTWLHRIAVNVCLNRVASRRPANEPIEGREIADRSAHDPLAGLVASERAAAVRRAIAELPPKQRAAVILRVYQELSHEEIARVLGGTVGAAKASVFHALGNLRRLVRRGH